MPASVWNVDTRHTCTNPSVMLSPNATKRVAESRGTRVTVTWNAHDADWARVSRALHVTLVDPTGNWLLVDGVQLVETTPLPPDTDGFG